MQQGVTELKGGDEDMIAFSYKIHDGIDLRGIRLHPGHNDDIGFFSLSFIRIGGAIPPHGRPEVGGGIFVDADLCIRKEVGQVLVSKPGAVGDLILTPECDPAIELFCALGITGEEGKQ
jgi:hypothetical protein